MAKKTVKEMLNDGEKTSARVTLKLGVKSKREALIVALARDLDLNSSLRQAVRNDALAFQQENPGTWKDLCAQYNLSAEKDRKKPKKGA